MHEKLLQTKTFGVVRETRVLPNGRCVDKTFVTHPGGVVLLPLLDDDTILMVRNYRVTLQQWLRELPAGTLEPPESPRDCAARELREETGYDASRIEPFIEFHTAPGFCNELLRVFLARDLTHVGQDLQSDECMTVEKVPLSQAIDQACSGELRDAKTIATLCAWALRCGREQP
jgi:ADP-ribose pyrophosphatase